MNRSTQMFVSCIFVIFGMFATACSGTDHTTVELEMPPEQCIAGHHEACWCEDGSTGHQVCRDDGMAYGHCECPDDAADDAGIAPEASTEDAATEPDAETEAGNDAEADAEPDAGLNLLRVWMASTPTSAEVKPGSKNVPVLGLDLQAYQTAGDVHISAIGISCRASIGGEEYEGIKCWERVDRIELIDENNNQLAPADMPDMAAGIVYYAVQYTVQEGETRKLTVRADFSAEASESEPYDKISFDLAGLQNAESGIATEDATVVVGHGFGLNQQGEDPKVEFTIVPEAAQQPITKPVTVSLSVSDYNLKRDVAGNTTEPVLSFEVKNDNDFPVCPKSFQVAQVGARGKVQDIQELNLAQMVLNQDISFNSNGFDANSVYTFENIEMLGTGCISPWAQVDFIVKARFAVPESSAHLGLDLPRFGDRPQLKLVNIEFADNIPVEFADDVTGPELTLFKNIVQIGPAFMDTALGSGEREIFCFWAGASPEEAGLKQFMLQMKLHQELNLREFRLTRDGAPLAEEAYTIRNSVYGNDLYLGNTYPMASGQTITIAFTHEEVLDSNASKYCVKATIDGYNANNGQFVKTEFFLNEYKEGEGYLTHSSPNTAYLQQKEFLNIDTDGDGGADILSSLLVTDFSENPYHSDQAYLTRDWAVTLPLNPFTKSLY